MVHNPKHADPSYPLNIVGHVHEKWAIKRLSPKSIMVNVGVDVWDFKPVSFEEINKRLNQWKKEEALGKNIMEVNVPQTTQEQAIAIMETLRKGESWQGEFEVQRKDGSTRSRNAARIKNDLVGSKWNACDAGTTLSDR